VNVTLEASSWARAQWKENISQFDLSELHKSAEHERLSRLFKAVEVLGFAALDDDKLAQRTNIESDMTSIYSSAKICPFDKQNCDLKKDTTWSLEPELTELFRVQPEKENFEKLEYVWAKWRDASGKLIRQKYLDYVRLSNEAAIANKLKPFYQELHAYVRHKLRQFYGEEKISAAGPIPAHVLGMYTSYCLCRQNLLEEARNMWAQNWESIFPAVSEFKTKSLDVTDEMLKQNYTVRRMFEISDKFFEDLGLISVNDGAADFYGLSMLERPEDGREVVCHASAWDFSATNKLPGDFRIKMCTRVNMNDLIVVHHELGHIQYGFQYVNQSPLFRDGANPGFHEAIGDTLALSVSTPKHLKSIGLLSEDFKVDDEAELAFLLRMALEKVAFLPFSYAMDLYRWKIFDGSITTKNLNSEWWKLREGFQGITPPLKRSEEDFDAGSKFHVAAGVPYIRYFVAFIL
ncbi:unnamed protein product, partial [Notodromas monacha]